MQGGDNDRKGFNEHTIERSISMNSTKVAEIASADVNRMRQVGHKHRTFFHELFLEPRLDSYFRRNLIIKCFIESINSDVPP